MLLYLLLFENVHDRNTVYKKYIFCSLERFSSDKQQIKFTDLKLAYLDDYNLLDWKQLESQWGNELGWKPKWSHLHEGYVRT